MAHEQHAALEVVDGLGKCVDGLHVEVVGGFVQQQHVGTLVRQPREADATPLAVRQVTDRTRLSREMVTDA